VVLASLGSKLLLLCCESLQFSAARELVFGHRRELVQPARDRDDFVDRSHGSILPSMNRSAGGVDRLVEGNEGPDYLRQTRRVELLTECGDLLRRQHSREVQKGEALPEVQPLLGL
jgi:hypothetical protein